MPHFFTLKKICTEFPLFLSLVLMTTFPSALQAEKEKTRKAPQDHFQKKNTLTKPLDTNQTRGYVGDVVYEITDISWQSPVSILKAAEVNGFQGPDINKPFRYLDLGTGRGYTLLHLAARFPHGEFWGVDMMKEHVDEANEKATQLGLNNVHFIQATFQNLDIKSLGPSFDFVTANGVLSWIDETARGEIFSIIGKVLGEKGLLYISYNAFPGWAQYQPLSPLFQALSADQKGLSTDKLSYAITQTKKLKDMGALFFQLHPRAVKKLSELSGKDRLYLVHEYMNKAHIPFYFYEMNGFLKNIGFQYAGDTKILRNYPPLFLSADQAKFCEKITQLEHRETVKDFCGNTVFRRDVFAKKSNASQKPGALGSFTYAIIPYFQSNDKKYDVNQNTFDLNKGLFSVLVKILEKGPLTLQQIHQANNETKKYTPSDILAHLHVLCEANAITAMISLEGFNALKNNGINKALKGEKLQLSSALDQEILDHAVALGSSAKLSSRGTGERIHVSAQDAVLLKAIMAHPPQNVVPLLEKIHYEKGGLLPANTPSQQVTMRLKKEYDTFMKEKLPSLFMLSIVSYFKK